MKASYSNGTMFALDVLDRMYKLNYYEELDNEKRTKCFASMEAQRVERVRDLDWSCVTFNIIFFCMIQKGEIVKIHMTLEYDNCRIENDVKFQDKKSIVLSTDKMSLFLVLLNAVRIMSKVHEMFEKQEQEFPYNGVIAY